MSLFRRREREAQATARMRARRGSDLPREEQAPCPRCAWNVLEQGDMVGVDAGLTSIECPSCRWVSRWDLAAAVPLLVRDP